MAQAAVSSSTGSATDVLGDEAEALLTHVCKTIDKSLISHPGPDFIDRVVSASDRPVPVLRTDAMISDRDFAMSPRFWGDAPSIPGYFFV